MPETNPGQREFVGVRKTHVAHGLLAPNVAYAGNTSGEAP